MSSPRSTGTYTNPWTRPPGKRRAVYQLTGAAIGQPVPGLLAGPDSGDRLWLDPHGGAVCHRGGEAAERVKNSPHGVPWGLSIFLWRERPFPALSLRKKPSAAAPDSPPSERHRWRRPSISSWGHVVAGVEQGRLGPGGLGQCCPPPDGWKTRYTHGGRCAPSPLSPSETRWWPPRAPSGWSSRKGRVVLDAVPFHEVPQREAVPEHHHRVLHPGEEVLKLPVQGVQLRPVGGGIGPGRHRRGWVDVRQGLPMARVMVAAFRGEVQTCSSIPTTSPTVKPSAGSSSWSWSWSWAGGLLHPRHGLLLQQLHTLHHPQDLPSAPRRRGSCPPRRRSRPPGRGRGRSPGPPGCPPGGARRSGSPSPGAAAASTSARSPAACRAKS